MFFSFYFMLQFVELLHLSMVYHFHDMIDMLINCGYEKGTTLFGYGYDFRQSNRYFPIYGSLCMPLCVELVTSILSGPIVHCRPVLQAQDAVTVVLSGRIDKAMAGLRTKLETAYKTSGGKKVNLISHSMGGLLVRCFMSMNPDVSFHVCYTFCLCINIHVVIFSPFSRYSLSMSTNGFALLVHFKVTYWTFQLIYSIIAVL